MRLAAAAAAASAPVAARPIKNDCHREKRRPLIPDSLFFLKCLQPTGKI